MKNWLILIFYAMFMAAELYLICASIYYYVKGDIAEATYDMVLFIALMCVRIYARGDKK